MDVKKTIKFDGKLKAVHMMNGKVIDMNGEVVDILNDFEKTYGDIPFDISTTTKIEEAIDLDDVDGAVIDNLN